MSVTITSCETKKVAGKTVKEISLDGDEPISMWSADFDGHPTVGFNDARVGSVGNAEIYTTKAGKKSILSWHHESQSEAPKTPADAPSGYFGVKDRLICLQNAHTGASAVVAALITAGKIKDVSEALTALDSLKQAQFSDCVAVSENKYVFHGYDVFAD